MAKPYTAFTTRPEIRGTFGVVASTHWIASSVGMAMLERGGNAFDAAIAAAFSLQLLEPHLNGPGGEVPVIFWSEREQRARVLCGQGVAPQAATLDHFRSRGLHLVPGTGLWPAVVPGAFDAWLQLLRDYGTMSLADVLAPAIGYAQNGVPLVPRIVQAIGAVKKLFEDEWPGSAAIYLPGGRVPSVREIFRNPSTGATYARVLAEAERAGGGQRERVIEAARRIWSQGWVAEAIDRFVRETPVLDTTGERNRGLLTGEDIAGWSASYDAPATIDYGRYTVAKCGIWSQGPMLLQTLALLRGTDIARCDPLGADFVHLVTEAAKLALADRDTWYADPDMVASPLDALLAERYTAERRALIGERASLEHRPGAPAGKRGRFPDWRAAAADVKMDQYFYGLGEPTFAELPDDDEVDPHGVMAGDTVHLDVIDRWGNMVSATPSGGWLSSSPVIPALGFPLGTRGQMFWLEPEHPSVIAPRKRPRTTLSPALAFRDGQPWAVFGTPGGDQQDQWQAALFLRVALHGMNWQEAIDAPGWHTKHNPTSFWPRQAQPGVLSMESRWSSGVLDALAARGHKLTIGEPWSEGRLTACAREDTAAGRILKAAANPRGMQGYAVGR
jgi:gamma-glutamyltranspeptidase / glutathione hydrolase